MIWWPNEIPTLQYGRVTLRPPAESDVEQIFEACQDKEIQFWTTIPRPYLIEHANGFVNGDFPEYKIWAIENEESKPVGVISIHEVDESGAAEDEDAQGLGRLGGLRPG